VQPLFLRHGDEAWTSINRSHFSMQRQPKFSSAYMCTKCIPSWILVVSVMVLLEFVVSCHGLYRGQATNHCTCCVLWNEWEEGKVTQIILVASTGFSVLTNWSQPLISFVWYEETVMWTMCVVAIFVCHSNMCIGKEVFCKLNYSWHQPLIFLCAEGTM
jgi:hypothetical protein